MLRVQGNDNNLVVYGYVKELEELTQQRLIVIEEVECHLPIRVCDVCRAEVKILFLMRFIYSGLANFCQDCKDCGLD